MTKINLKFRTATLDDAPQLQRLVESAFRAEDIRANWTDNLGLSADFRVPISEITAIITKPDSVMLMATDHDNNLVGTIGTSKRDAKHARLFMIAVDQARQCDGVGRQILAHAEDYAQKTWGVTSLGLNALSNRKLLIAWYVRQGYEDTGEVTPFPRERHENLALPHDLCFVEFEKQFV